MALIWISLFSDVEHHFYALRAIHVPSLEKYLFNSFVYFLSQIFFFFLVTQLYDYFFLKYTYFGYLPLIRCMTWKYFLLFCRLSLHLVDCFSCWGKLFSLMEFYLSVFASLLVLLVSTTILDNI